MRAEWDPLMRQAMFQMMNVPYQPPKLASTQPEPKQPQQQQKAASSSSASSNKGKGKKKGGKK